MSDQTPVYLNTAEAAVVARKHPVTIRRALEAGDLHGTQQLAGGRWAIRSECLEAYVERRACAHRAAGRGKVAQFPRRVA